MIARRFSALAALAVLGLGACTSEPGPRTVAREIVETLDVDDDVKACMTERIDTYSDGTLDAIGDQPENADFSSANPDDEGITAELREFIDDLQSCVDDPGAASDASTATTATDDSAPATTSD